MIEEWRNGVRTLRDPTQAEAAEIGDGLDDTLRSIDNERDKRIATRFSFSGKAYDFDTASKARITGMATLAGFAIGAGIQPGNMRWHGGDSDFAWIASDNGFVPMDAHICFSFGQAAAAHELAHIFAARALKDMEVIPNDYTDDQYWP
jgi:hypothetical protein